MIRLNSIIDRLEHFSKIDLFNFNMHLFYIITGVSICTILKHIPVKTSDEDTWNKECPKPHGICLQAIQRLIIYQCCKILLTKSFNDGSGIWMISVPLKHHIKSPYIRPSQIMVQIVASKITPEQE